MYYTVEQLSHFSVSIINFFRYVMYVGSLVLMLVGTCQPLSTTKMGGLSYSA